MNKSKVILNVSEKSGINAKDCEKVLNAFEQVLNKEISDSRSVGKAFDKIYQLMSFIKKGKENE